MKRVACLGALLFPIGLTARHTPEESARLPSKATCFAASIFIAVFSGVIMSGMV
jgi:hypothetical protein